MSDVNVMTFIPKVSLTWWTNEFYNETLKINLSSCKGDRPVFPKNICTGTLPPSSVFGYSSPSMCISLYAGMSVHLCKEHFNIFLMASLEYKHYHKTQVYNM